MVSRTYEKKLSNYFNGNYAIIKKSKDYRNRTFQVKINTCLFSIQHIFSFILATIVKSICETSFFKVYEYDIFFNFFFLSKTKDFKIHLILVISKQSP